MRSIALALFIGLAACSSSSSDAPAGSDGGAEETSSDGFEGTVLHTDTVNGMAVDGRHVYFTDNWNGVMRRVPVTGGATEDLITSGEFGYPTEVVTDDAYAWVATGMDVHHALLRVTKSDKTFDSKLPAEGCEYMVGSTEYLFCSTSSTGGVKRIKKSDLSSGVVWESRISFADAALAADDVHLVGIGSSMDLGEWVAVAPHGTETPSLAFIKPAVSTAIATDQGNIWIATTDEAMSTATLGRFIDGKVSPVLTLETKARGAITAIALDATHVYYATAGGTESAEILRVPIAGGTPAHVGFGTSPYDLRLDANAVYWADADPADDKKAVIERRLKSKLP